MWEGSSALIFVSNADGYASYGRLHPDLSFTTFPRVDAIRRSAHLWDCFHHIGDVPSEAERQIVASLTEEGTSSVDAGGRTTTGAADSPSDAGDAADSPVRVPPVCLEEDFAESDTCEVATASSVKVKGIKKTTATKYIIDTGCAHDFVVEERGRACIGGPM